MVPKSFSLGLFFIVLGIFQMLIFGVLYGVSIIPFFFRLLFIKRELICGNKRNSRGNSMVNFGNELEKDWGFDECEIEQNRKLVALGGGEYIAVFSVKTTVMYNLSGVAAIDFLYARYSEDAAKEVERTYKTGSSWRCYVPKDFSKTVAFEKADINTQNFAILRYVEEDGKQLVDNHSSKRVVGIVFMSLSSVWFVAGLFLLFISFPPQQN